MDGPERTFIQFTFTVPCLPSEELPALGVGVFVGFGVGVLVGFGVVVFVGFGLGVGVGTVCDVFT